MLNGTFCLSIYHLDGWMEGKWTKVLLFPFPLWLGPIDIEGAKIDCSGLFMCPLLAQGIIGFFSFFLLRPFTVLMKKTHAVKQSIIFRCLCLVHSLPPVLFYSSKQGNADLQEKRNKKGIYNETWELSSRVLNISPGIQMYNIYNEWQPSLVLGSQGRA